MQIDEIKSVILAALNEILTERGLEAVGDKDGTQLFGEGSVIDSLDLVTIIVQIEEAIREKDGRSIEVVDENSVINIDSPFRTVDSLAKMVKEKLDA